MAKIVSKPSTEEYRVGWEFIFNKNKESSNDNRTLSENEDVVENEKTVSGTKREDRPSN